MRELHYNFRLGQTTLSTIIRDVCAVIWDKLQTCLTLPASANDWMKIADGFEKHANFPHCIGSIDGKHIRLIQPADSGSMYYNYKHFYSLVLMAACDANYNFIFIDVGAYGKSSDSAIFQDTELYKKLISNTLNIPEPHQISENDPTLFPYVFIGDEAFGLSTNIMRPYGGNNLSTEKKIFNYRLSRARRYIECTFGILTNKWRILHRPLNVHTELAKSIVRTLCVLHNFVRSRDGYSYDDTLTITGFQTRTQHNFTRGGRAATTTRDNFSHYFINENPLPWQNNSIH